MMQTVFVGLNTGEFSHMEKDTKVDVQIKRPEVWDVLLECHIPEADLTLEDGVGVVLWSTISDHPYSLSTR